MTNADKTTVLHNAAANWEAVTPADYCRPGTITATIYRARTIEGYPQIAEQPIETVTMTEAELVDHLSAAYSSRGMVWADTVDGVREFGCGQYIDHLLHDVRAVVAA